MLYRLLCYYSETIFGDIKRKLRKQPHIYIVACHFFYISQVLRPSEQFITLTPMNSLGMREGVSKWESYRSVVLVSLYREQLTFCNLLMFLCSLDTNNVPAMWFGTLLYMLLNKGKNTSTFFPFLYVPLIDNAKVAGPFMRMGCFSPHSCATLFFTEVVKPYNRITPSDSVMWNEGHFSFRRLIFQQHVNLIWSFSLLRLSWDKF